MYSMSPRGGVERRLLAAAAAGARDAHAGAPRASPALAASRHVCDNTPMQDGFNRRARGIGLVLFAVYCAAYAGFVATAAFGTFSAGAADGGLARPVIAGVNLAVVYGFALIVGAFALAVLYAFLARGSDE